MFLLRNNDRNADPPMADATEVKSV